MKLAFERAWSVQGETLPNPPVGALVVRENRVIGKGATQRAGGHHAE